MLERTDKLLAISPQDYRDAMSHFAGAVNVVTTDGEAGRRGVTVSAAVSISDDPPTVVVCLNRNRAENLWFQANGCFAINTLTQNHLGLARAFAGEDHLSMSDRFALSKWTRLETGAPILPDARMAFDCVVTDIQSVHTHYMVFGRVVASSDGNRDPALLYIDRGYQSI